MNYIYAQISLPSRVVEGVSLLHEEVQSETMVPVPTYDTSLVGKRHVLETNTFEDVPLQSAGAHKATKRAFQNRFPKATNGISTKWDSMCLFLADDGYAASLGVTGATLYELRMLITTGVQRLSASPFVDMAATGEAAAMTGLLTNPAIPEAFRLTAAERTAMMETPLADSEIYKG